MRFRRPRPVASYEAADLVDVVFLKTVATRDGQPIDATTARLALPWLVGSPRRVLDFGGACGARYFALRGLIPPDVEWHVVETPAMVERARELEDEHLHFHTGIEGIDPDLVIASGSLQFAPDPVAALRDLVALGAPTIVVTRTELATGTTPIRSIQQSRLAWNGAGPLPPGIADRVVEYPMIAAPVGEILAALEPYDLLPFAEHESPPGGSTGTGMYGWLGRRR